MKFIELPKETQEQLLKERKELHNQNIDCSYSVHLYNEEGTRIFRATRICKEWGDNKGHSMPFGGGSYWKILYGKTKIVYKINPIGEKDFYWVEGKQFTAITTKKGTVQIPKELNTKKEVIELVKKIGLFNIK